VLGGKKHLRGGDRAEKKSFPVAAIWSVLKSTQDPALGEIVHPAKGVEKGPRSESRSQGGGGGGVWGGGGGMNKVFTEGKRLLHEKKGASGRGEEKLNSKSWLGRVLGLLWSRQKPKKLLRSYAFEGGERELSAGGGPWLVEKHTEGTCWVVRDPSYMSLPGWLRGAGGNRFRMCGPLLRLNAGTALIS